MRAAIFTDNDFAKVNGVTTTLQAVLAHAPPGIRARVYTASDHAVDRPDYLALRSPGVPIPFYTEMRLYVPRVRELMRRVTADGADLIHLTTPGPMGLAAMRVARMLRVPLVGSFHTDLAAYAQILSGSSRLGAVMREFMRWPYGRCARVLAPSESTKRLLIGAKGDPGRIRIWRRGVDSDHFHPRRRSLALRRKWGVSAARPAILYVGRVSREKGLSLLPGIERELDARGLPHRFIVAGHGPMFAELQAGLRGAVFTGVLSREEVADAYASADVFVFPSTTDTAGNVVLEAQASGLPVMVTNVGGPQENLDDGRSGHVLGEMSAGAWADALEPLLRSRPLLEAASRAARSYGESRTWTQALDPLFAAYRDVMGEPAVSLGECLAGDSRAS